MTGSVASKINKVCVIGAGTMGSGIAAQVANAGYEVLLLDIASNEGSRNAVAERSLERIQKSDPPLLMQPKNIDRISIGNIDDDLALVADCDWVVEAIIEQLEVKKKLYRQLTQHLKSDALVSSNTSTIPISLLVEGMDEEFRRNFCITHFFNPVRYMRLLELVSGEDTDPQVMQVLSRFCEEELGKGIVDCADTPGFLGNRVGVFAMQAAIYQATKLGIDIEDADALFGRPMGIPKTGAFGLYDLIGVDLMADVVRSLVSILPEEDPFHEVGKENPLINSMIEQGYTGNKGKGGFYSEDNGKQLAIDLKSGARRERKSGLPELAVEGEAMGLKHLVEGDDALSQYAWNVLAQILTYSASLVPDVTHSPQDIDDAMKLGYNWVQGPFEMMDELGIEWFVSRLRKEGWDVPAYLEQSGDNPVYKAENGVLNVRHWEGQYQPIKLPEGVVRFSMMRRTLEPAMENESASLFHLEDGVRLVEFHTKANALDAECMQIVSAAAEDPGKGIIVHNDAQHFSAGVNLGEFLRMIKSEDWDGIDQFLIGFQSGVHDLLYCDAPVIGAPSGLAIGGGYEVLAHCDRVIAHTNSVMGLVEATVGLVPGGGGVKETYLRWYNRLGDWKKAAWNTFNQVGYSQTGSSPHLSSELCYFMADRDQTVMNRDRLVNASLSAIDEMKTDYRPRGKPEFVLTGDETYQEMVKFLKEGRDKGWFFDHDVTVASAVAAIVTGGPDSELQEVDEQHLYDLERKSFISLAKTAETRARIESMLSGAGVIRN